MRSQAQVESREKLRKRIEFKCTGCGEEILLRPCHARVRKYCGIKCYGKSNSKENSYHWIKDRTQLKKQNRRNDPAYFEWRKQVWLRDNFKCKLANPECNGKIEAHHILGWSNNPKLRYQISNGITLRHAHHPRKRAEEKRLIPVFNELVSVSKV